MTNNIYKVISICPKRDVSRTVVDGADTQHRTAVNFGQARFCALSVGEEGRGRTLRFIPVTNLPAPEKVDFYEFHIACIRLRRGRAGWIGEKMPDTSAVSGSLVLLDTAGGFRGYNALPTVLGAAQIIETGWCAQGAAGRAGWHPQVMILAIGPARVEWHRSGRRAVV